MITQIVSTLIHQPGDFVKYKASKAYFVIISIHEYGMLSVTYNAKRLKTFKYWPIKQLQLWAIKKAFK